MNPSDGELVARVASGERSAFDALIRRHFRAAWAAALAIVCSAEDADDVCQDAFVRAWERLDQCRQPDRFRGWLLSVVRSVACNRLDRERVRATLGLDTAMAVAAAESVTWSIDRRELREQLLAALCGLGEVERTVLLLSDLEQWRHREIAEALHITEVMSRRHLSDARRKMRQRLATHGAREELR